MALLPYWSADIEDTSILHFVTAEAPEVHDAHVDDDPPDLCGECCGDHLHQGELGEEAWDDLRSRLLTA